MPVPITAVFNIVLPSILVHFLVLETTGQAVECAPWKATRYIQFGQKVHPVKAKVQSSQYIGCRGRVAGEPFDIRLGSVGCEGNELMEPHRGVGRRPGPPAGGIEGGWGQR